MIRLLFLNAIKTAGGNNTDIICDGKWLNQGFFKILNKTEAELTTDKRGFFAWLCLIIKCIGFHYQSVKTSKSIY